MDLLGRLGKGWNSLLYSFAFPLTLMLNTLTSQDVIVNQFICHFKEKIINKLLKKPHGNCLLLKIKALKQYSIRNIYLESYSVLQYLENAPRSRKPFVSETNLTLKKTVCSGAGNGDCNIISAQRGESYLPLLCPQQINYIGTGLHIKSNRDQKTLPDLLRKMKCKGMCGVKQHNIPSCIIEIKLFCTKSNWEYISRESLQDQKICSSLEGTKQDRKTQTYLKRPLERAKPQQRVTDFQVKFCT